MRSKWRRYSSSNALRSPCCARSTSARTRAGDSRGERVEAVASSAINEGMPGGVAPVTPPSPALRAETDAGVTREPLHVDDAAQGDRVPAVLGIEREGGLAGAGADLGRRERVLERVCAVLLDDRAHHLAAVEPDLDADAVLASQLKRPPTKPRRRSPGGRTRPGARRALPGARRR